MCIIIIIIIIINNNNDDVSSAKPARSKCCPHLFVLTFVQLPLGKEIDVKGLPRMPPTSPARSRPELNFGMMEIGGTLR